MMKSIRVIACFVLVVLTAFTSCSKDDDSFSAELLAYFEKNREYIGEKKTEKDANGALLYKQVIAYGDTALYRVLSKEGTETGHPSVNTRLTLFLGGKLINGTVFQKEMSMNFAPGEVITGLNVILQQNTVGETVEAIIPASLGYGYNNNATIPAGSTLIFKYKIEKEIK